MRVKWFRDHNWTISKVVSMTMNQEPLWSLRFSDKPKIMVLFWAAVRIPPSWPRIKVYYSNHAVYSLGSILIAKDSFGCAKKFP